MSKYEYLYTSRLINRIKENYEDFRKMTLRMDGESIFKHAPMIAAVEDVYLFMTTHDWVDRQESDYLLEMENPLLFLAEEWVERSACRDRDFEGMIAELMDNNDGISYSTADKLRVKYGDDTPLNTACLLELVEIFGDDDDGYDDDFYYETENDDYEDYI